MSLKIAVENHLKGLASTDELFAVTFAKPNKSLDECCKYIMQEVGKMKKENNCVALPDDAVYKMAVHYYDEDSIVVASKPVQATVSHSSDKLKPNATKDEVIKHGRNQSPPIPAKYPNKNIPAPVVPAVKKPVSKKPVIANQPTLF